MINSSPDPPAPTKAANKDLKDMDVLCAFKIKTESQNLELGCVKDLWLYPNKNQDAKPQSEPPVLTKAPSQYLKDMVVLCIFKIKIESLKSEHGCIKDHRPYPNQDQNAKPE